MTEKTHLPSNNSSNFWFGLIVGVLGSSAILYLLGTNKGRAALKEMISYIEEHENSSEEHITKYIQTLFKTLQKEEKAGK